MHAPDFGAQRPDLPRELPLDVLGGLGVGLLVGGLANLAVGVPVEEAAPPTVRPLGGPTERGGMA